MAKRSDKASKEDRDDLLAEARRMFTLCADAENDNRTTALDDIKFARLGEQWPEDIREERRRDGRPCLTINKMPAFIRQVVNDARQNKPSIKVHPADSGADPETAEILNGLIRNIEYTSSADVAYDTGVECAVTGGFGYWRVGLDYAFDDSFDMDIGIQRIANPFSVYGDPNSTAADSSDWNVAFVIERMDKEEFKRKYKGKAIVDFGDDAWNSVGDAWMDQTSVMVAEYWTREEYERVLVQTEDGQTYDLKDFETDEDLAGALEVGLIQLKTDQNGQPIRRIAKAHKVRQVIMSGIEVLEEREWPGKYIPIVPVYGDEFDVEGKRHLRSLIHNAVDAARMHNYWRTTATELVALAPRVPYIGDENAFDADPNWATANTKSHSYLKYAAGSNPPMRQTLDSGVAAGALQEALTAADDIKAIIGLHDASLGARTNETSGRAIMARQREGDVSTFHFIDNMARAIRHTGRIIIDLIPKVYNTARIVRVIGEDGTQEAKQVNQEVETGETDEMGNAIMAMHDLSAGKYDLTVTTGPSYTTRREEAALQMTEMVRAFPQMGQLVGDLIAKNMDWPGADEIAKRLRAVVPPHVLGEEGEDIPPQAQQMIQQGKQMLEHLQQENEQLKSGQAEAMAKLELEREIEFAKIQSEEAIEAERLRSQERIAQMKALSQPNQFQPAPQRAF
jgi:hypothetical protein